MFLSIFDLEESRELSQHRRSVELLVRALILKLDYVLNVVVSITVEFALHFLLFLTDLVLRFLKLITDAVSVQI